MYFWALEPHHGIFAFIHAQTILRPASRDYYLINYWVKWTTTPDPKYFVVSNHQFVWFRRSGDVEVMNAEGHVIVKSEFSVGPLQLEVSKSVSGN